MSATEHEPMTYPVCGSVAYVRVRGYPDDFVVELDDAHRACEVAATDPEHDGCAVYIH